MIHRVQRRGSAKYDRRTRDQFAEKYKESVAQTKNLFDSLSSGERVDGGAVIAASTASIEQMTEEFDLFVSLGLQPDADSYPYQHSQQTSMLAAALGTVMGLGQEQLMEMSIGCLLHDVGMLHLDPGLYETDRLLDPIEFLEITKHPIHTFDMIRDVPELPIGSRMVSYQMHERFNGSGYPRHRQGKQIHPLARIAAVADVFVAMISPRPHRPGVLPYHAVEEVIRGGHNGVFDPEVVRALLHTVSLFPIGSFVELTDDRVGTVIRSNGENYANPVVEVAPAQGSDKEPEAVDLANNDELAVKRPLSVLPGDDADVNAADDVTAGPAAATTSTNS